MTDHISCRLRRSVLLFFFLLAGLHAPAQEQIYPDKPNPPTLVNDYAHMLTGDEVNQLEAKLDAFANSTSTQVTIVTIKNLGGHDVEEYSVGLFNSWGLGEKGKNNGVLLMFSLDDRKAWITVGKGLEGVLTDAKSGQIFRRQLMPAFQAGHYYQGLSDATDAIIAVTKGEYTADGPPAEDHHVPVTAIIILVIFIIIIIRIMRGGGGGGGGNYRGSGWGGFATGLLLGNLLGGGWGGDRDGGNWGGGDSGGGGDFGGFGGGSTDGGGAGGSW